MIVTRIIFVISSALVVNLCIERSVPASLVTMSEICENAIDDDMDGMIDLNDADCECTVIKPESLIPILHLRI